MSRARGLETIEGPWPAARDGRASLVLTLLMAMVTAAGPGGVADSDPDTWWHLVMGHPTSKDVDQESLAAVPVQDRGLALARLAGPDHGRGVRGPVRASGRGLALRSRNGRARGGDVPDLPVAGLVRRRSLWPRRWMIASMTSLTAAAAAGELHLRRRSSSGAAPDRRRLRARWWLALLTGVWACVHGMWFLSIAAPGSRARWVSCWTGGSTAQGLRGHLRRSAR